MIEQIHPEIEQIVVFTALTEFILPEMIKSQCLEWMDMRLRVPLWRQFPPRSWAILPPENGLCPSVDFLFRSVADVMSSHAIGMLLTGMGKDGAKELKTMKDYGATTLVQDEASCVIFGMPGEAVRIGAADHVLTPEKIAELISSLCKE